MGSSELLRGITWNHTRGYIPLVATGQRFQDLFPGVEISWEKRSLREFGDAPLDELAQRFDLRVVDHTHAGYAAACQILEPLEDHLAPGFLTELAESSVDQSYSSYWFNGHLWALPVDAAAPVSSWHPDLMEGAGIAVPRTWARRSRSGPVRSSGAASRTLRFADSLFHDLLCTVRRAFLSRRQRREPRNRDCRTRMFAGTHSLLPTRVPRPQSHSDVSGKGHR